jgi:hypothetical protein
MDVERELLEYRTRDKIPRLEPEESLPVDTVRLILVGI